MGLVSDTHDTLAELFKDFMIQDRYADHTGQIIHSSGWLIATTNVIWIITSNYGSINSEANSE